MAGLVPRGRRQPLWWTLRQPGAAADLSRRAPHVRAGQPAGRGAGDLHALRHTAAYRMAEDPALPLTDVQFVLGHAQLTTTQIYLTPRKRGRYPPGAGPPRRAGPPGGRAGGPHRHLATGLRRSRCCSGGPAMTAATVARPWRPGAQATRPDQAARERSVPAPPVASGPPPARRPGRAADTASAGLPESRSQRQSAARPPVLLDWLGTSRDGPGSSGGWPAGPTPPATWRQVPPGGCGAADVSPSRRTLLTGRCWWPSAPTSCGLRWPGCRRRRDAQRPLAAEHGLAP